MPIENKFPGKDISNDDIKTKFPLCAKNKKNKKTFKINNVLFGGKKIPIMAGPNMVESLKLVDDCAKIFKKNKIDFLRGGAFKPLTFPYRSKKYCETREKGIEWLKIVKEKYNIPVITEVMEEKFLPLICEVSDILQIGSRNMQNFPFLTVCAKTQKPIMLKRHYGASLRDLLGAAEYLLIEGNHKILLCERGITVPHTHKETSRFLLDIQAIPALKEITHLPVIVDPSHASFWSPWVPSLAKAAIAAGADGLMMEVHPDPKNAAVDSLQPLSFNEFQKLLPELKKVAKSVNRKI
tara:strand:+ start:588 stop:1472 length:885 start_codon:yes stop_codon:yes gene_type:complete